MGWAQRDTAFCGSLPPLEPCPIIGPVTASSPAAMFAPMSLDMRNWRCYEPPVFAGSVVASRILARRLGPVSHTRALSSHDSESNHRI